MKLLLNKKGYTLTEVMIVVAIIGTLAALSVPSFNKFTAHQNLNGAARELFSDVRSARVTAIKDGVQYSIYFPSSTRFELRKALTPTYTSFAPAVAANVNPYYSVVTTYDLAALGYKGVTITVPTIIPIFQRTGAVSSEDTSVTPVAFSTSAPGNIVLTNSYGETKTIIINMAGYALIQ